MAVKHVANTTIKYQSPTTGENKVFEPGETIPDKYIEDWPANALNANITAGRISLSSGSGGGRKPKPGPEEASSPTEASIADVKKGIEDGIWTLDEVLEAEKALPEDEQRKGILDLEPEDEPEADEEPAEDDEPEGDDE